MYYKWVGFVHTPDELREWRCRNAGPEKDIARQTFCIVHFSFRRPKYENVKLKFAGVGRIFEQVKFDVSSLRQ